jgi:hypothetical protein
MSDDETRRGTGDDATHPKRRPPIEDNKVRAMVVGPIVYGTIRQKWQCVMLMRRSLRVSPSVLSISLLINGGEERQGGRMCRGQYVRFRGRA